MCYAATTTDTCHFCGILPVLAFAYFGRCRKSTSLCHIAIQSAVAIQSVTKFCNECRLLIIGGSPEVPGGPVVKRPEEVVLEALSMAQMADEVEPEQSKSANASICDSGDNIEDLDESVESDSIQLVEIPDYHPDVDPSAEQSTFLPPPLYFFGDVDGVKTLDRRGLDLDLGRDESSLEPENHLYPLQPLTFCPSARIAHWLDQMHLPADMELHFQMAAIEDDARVRWNAQKVARVDAGWWAQMRHARAEEDLEVLSWSGRQMEAKKREEAQLTIQLDEWLA